jgi:hypothetical protein
MATGLENQLTKQIGESLVVSELGRHGFIATSFTGNVPNIDILAMEESGRTFAVQVKAIRGPSWQFDIRTFLHVKLAEDTQIILGKNKEFDRKRMCIFVEISENSPDNYYIFQWGYLQDYFYKSYKGGKRPKNPTSFHCAIWPKDLQRYKNNWELLNKK